jgi:hypothetical protein
MSAPGDLDTAPTRAEVCERILALIGSDEQRQVVSGWAARWIRLPDPHVEDPVVWQAIQRLAGADLRGSRTTYLHKPTSWLGLRISATRRRQSLAAKGDNGNRALFKATEEIAVL